MLPNMTKKILQFKTVLGTLKIKISYMIDFIYTQNTYFR